MKGCYLAVCAIMSGLLPLLFMSRPLAAQVSGDTTLPLGERSRITGDTNLQIDGGARRGNNLFHSFREFSIPAGGSVFFNNATDIETIFNRVTGDSPSQIDGLIRANGRANLFLLNPQGIVFGPNARLNIGGSFIASTAESVEFNNGSEFSSVAASPSSLLTLSTPTGLQFGQNPGAIRVNGTGHELTVPGINRAPTIRSNRVTGLQVNAGQTLALLGGTVSLQGGTLTAEQGRIELGGVGSEERVILRSHPQGFAFDYRGVNHFHDIRLTGRALADASESGTIQVQGDRVSLDGASLFFIQNQGNQSGGLLSVDAARSLTVQSTSPDGRLRSGLDVQTLGPENGADIAVTTQQLVIQGGGAISARSFGTGDAGDITVNAADSIQVSGFSPSDLSRTSSISAVALSVGNSGDITITTRRLTLQDGGAIAVSTLGDGQGGSLSINAADSVSVIGARNESFISNVTAITQGNGNGGQITIQTARLLVRGGGAVSSATVARGDAGSVVINATEAAEVQGTSPEGTLPSRIQASAPIVSEEFRQLFQLPPRPIGSSGSVTIRTSRLNISDGASLEVSNDGLGDAGTLNVDANSIILDRASTITSATAVAAGGNINLRVGDILLMRRNSQITTSASGAGSGGNITITAPLLLALRRENSDIRANSQNANGGNITINASGIFGIQFREQPTALSDITATGANSVLNGNVQLNIEDLNPVLGLVELPTTLQDASGLIVARCSAIAGNDSFTLTGRGGIAPAPAQRLGNAPTWRDRRYLSPPPSDSLPQTHESLPIPPPTPPLVEATGWRTTQEGQVLLTATPAVNPQLSPVPTFMACGRE